MTDRDGYDIPPHQGRGPNWPSSTQARDPFDAARIVERTSDHAFGTWHHMVVVVWKGETTVGAVRRIDVCMHALAKERDAKIALLSIVETQAPMPTSEARKVTADALRGAPIQLSGMVFEGHGFGAAAVRAVITGIGLLAKTPYPHRTFARVEDSAAWIEKETRLDGPRAMTRDSIVRAVASLRGDVSTAKR